MDTIGILSDYLARELNQGRPLDESASLLERGVIDSLGLVKLVGFLEQRFAIALGDDELEPSHFETVTTIAQLVERKRIEARG
jgi:acyl carrier protein